jgi:hypothetical protein
MHAECLRIYGSVLKHRHLESTGEIFALAQCAESVGGSHHVLVVVRSVSRSAAADFPGRWGPRVWAALGRRGVAAASSLERG